MEARLDFDEEISPQPEFPKINFCFNWIKRQLVIVVCMCVAVAGFLIGFYLLSVTKELNLFSNDEHLSVERDASNFIARSLDTNVDPCDNFYQFACGGYTNTGNNEIDTRLIAILEDVGKPEDLKDLKQARLFYKSCKNSINESRDSANAELNNFINVIFDGFENVSSIESPEFARMLGRIRREVGAELTCLGDTKICIGGNYLFSVELTFEKSWINKTGFNLIKFKLGRAQKLADTVRIPASLVPVIRNFTTDAIVRSWHFHQGTEHRLGTPKNVLKLANRMVELEYSVIDAGTIFENHTAEIKKTEEQLSVMDLTDHQNDCTFDLAAFFQEIFSGTNMTLNLQTIKFSTGEIQYLNVLMKRLRQFSIEEIKNYLKWRTLYDIGIGTNSDFRETIEASEIMKIPFPEQSSGCMKYTKRYFDGPLTHSYINTYFNKDFKNQVKIMVNYTKLEFEASLVDMTWLKPADKDAIRKKLWKMHVQSAYPNSIDNSRNREDNGTAAVIRINAENSFFRNFIEVVRLNSLQDLQLFGTQVNYHQEWITSVFYSTAYNVLEFNSITFPAAYLQRPMIGNPRKYLDFGAIGFTIAHEILHAFESSGLKYDEDGTPVEHLLTPSSAASFKEKTQCFQEQYDKYVDLDCNVTVDGNKTLDENIADNGAIRLALKAYDSYVQRYGPEQPLTGLKYTPNQMFFISFAQQFCYSYDADTCDLRVLNTEHSPHQIRVKGAFDNSEEFQKAWNCPLPNPTLKNTCRVW